MARLLGVMSPEVNNLLLQAGEYVLGTLADPERSQFEGELQGGGEAQEAVTYWEKHLDSWCLAGAPVNPPNRVWNAIELGMDGEGEGNLIRNFWDNIRFWRPVALTALAATLVLFFYYRQPAPLPIPLSPPLLAMVGEADQAPRYLMTSYPEKRKLIVRNLRPISLPPGKSLELWMIPGEGKMPISCGIIPAQGEVEMTIPDKELPFIRAGVALAVSMEPVGGSPICGPSGPVMYQGTLQKI